jgi:tripartite-type tricarboxylate transporter receptor subunit TctC
MSTSKRTAAAPDLPSLAESPLIKGFDLTQWFGIVAPTGTPAPVIERMQKEVASILADEAFRAKLISQGSEPAVNTPAQFGAFMKSQGEMYGRIVKDANITVD